MGVTILKSRAGWTWTGEYFWSGPIWATHALHALWNSFGSLCHRRWIHYLKESNIFVTDFVSILHFYLCVTGPIWCCRWWEFSQGSGWCRISSNYRFFGKMFVAIKVDFVSVVDLIKIVLIVIKFHLEKWKIFTNI